VRAIFGWITENISYNTRGYSVSKKRKNDKVYSEPEDTSAELKPLVEHVAEIVLRRRTAVCDGYTKLFKALCDHAGVQNEIISGYGVSNYSSGKFKTNHTWNAVYTDSSWHLLDVTWASGFILAGDFIHRYDNYYFFTPPQYFIRDHYPEDLRWTLMKDPPVPREFYQAPFRYSEFLMQKMISFSPNRGILDVHVGDTIHFTAESESPNFSFSVTDSLRDDNEYWTLATAQNYKASCAYIVKDENVEWLYLICNNEPVLRYKLNVKKNH
jgi:transglutaminase/protease-like cytokinesis protein 3